MIVFYAILFLALFLRLINLENIVLGDECYSLYVIKNAYFPAIFQDAGNPPFYYLILKLEYLLFHFNIFGFKLTSILFSIGALIALWFLLKTKFNIKTANVGAFIFAISPVALYFSHEIRCYSLTMFLSPLIIYFLFQALQKRKNIYFIIYGLLGIIAVNTHYYEAIFLFLNFIFAVFYLKNRRKDLIKFVITNLIILISFMPFFALIAYKNALLNTGFNAYIEDISFSLINKQIYFIFGGILSFFLFVFFFFKVLLSKKIIRKKRIFIVYFTYIILGTIIISIVLSYCIRPMINDRYYCFLIPLFAGYLAIIFTSYKNKTYLIIFLIWLFCIQYLTKIKDMHSAYKFEQAIFSMVENNKNNYVITREITRFYIYYLDKYENINIITFPINKKELQNNVQKAIVDIFKKDKNAVIYTVLLNPDKNNPQANYTCFYNKDSDLCLWKITKN